MKNKLIRLLITSLTVTLIVLSVFTYRSYKNIHNKIQTNLKNQVKQEQTFRVIDKDVIVNKLNLENSLNILSGESTVQATFTDQKISDGDVNFKFLKTWFNNSTSKDINIEATYKFNFSYQLKDLPISIYNSTINIQLSYNRLNLNSIELINTDSTERLGWLTSQFTPNQINGINERVKQLAKNTIQSSDEYRCKAMESVQGDIKYLLQSVIGKDTSIHFEIIESSNMIQQDDVQIIR